MNKEPLAPTMPGADRSFSSVFGRLRNEIDHLFDDFSMSGQMRRIWPLPDGSDFSPLAELQDKDDHYLFAVELPGLDEKDISVELADGVLRISGEKQQETAETNGDCLISERSYGKFLRRLSLPAEADAEQIEAKYRHGVLKVTIGKDKNKPESVRKIPVS